MPKTKCIATIEFIYTRQIEIEYDELNEEPDNIVRNILRSNTSQLSDDYTNANTINVSYTYQDGTCTEWDEL